MDRHSPKADRSVQDCSAERHPCWIRFVILETPMCYGDMLSDPDVV